MVLKGLQVNSTDGAKGAGMSASSRLALLALGGVLTGFTLIFTQLGIFEWLTLIPAIYALLDMVRRRDVSPGRAYGYGLLFFMSFYIVIYHWFIFLWPLEFTGMNRGAAAVVVLAGWFGLSLLQALVGGLIFPLAMLFGRTKFVKSNGFIMPFLAAALWVIFEWSQTLFWTGVPWARLAIGQTDMPVMFQTASLFGSYFITFLVVAVNSTVAYALLERNKTRLCAMTAAGLIIFNAAAGVILINAANNQDEKKFTAAVVQANIGSGDKWDMKVADMLDIYIEYTRRAASEEPKPDIIVWPETAIPATLDEIPITADRIKKLASECGVPIIVGIFTDDAEGNEYNSLVLFNTDGTVSEETYSKRHLVPFGEYLPLRGIITTLIPPLGEIAMLDEDVTPGSDSGIIVSGGIKFGSLICFDSIYEQLARESLIDGAEVLVISTNDSWFYDSAAGRMHNSQAKLRAVESGRYVLRAANTGISSIITPAGKVIKQLEPLTAGYIVAGAGARDGKTIYMMTGNFFVALCAFFCILTAVSGLPLLMKRKIK